MSDSLSGSDQYVPFIHGSGEEDLEEDELGEEIVEGEGEEALEDVLDSAPLQEAESRNQSNQSSSSDCWWVTPKLCRASV